jgi:hypothetical protein
MTALSFMFGRRSRIVFYTAPVLMPLVYIAPAPVPISELLYSVAEPNYKPKTIDIMPAPVLRVRIRIVAMRIHLLALYFNWCTGSSAYGFGSIREL